MLKSTKYHDYSKNEFNSDFYSLDFRGDTIEKQINEYEDGNVVLSIYGNEYGNFIFKEFFKDGKVIGSTDYSNDMGKETYSYTSFDYYPNGDIKEEKYYKEERATKDN